jgi:hypothetical protein
MVPPLLLRIDSHIVADPVFREVVEQDNRSEMQIKGGRKGSGNIREEEYFYRLYLCLDGYNRETNTPKIWPVAKRYAKQLARSGPAAS